MDAQNPSAQLSMANRTPMRIGTYGLAVRDLDRCAAFYQRTVGFDVLERTSERAVLGVSGVALLHLEHRPDAAPDDKTTAGLFHTAFVMPTRRDLADWLRHARRMGLTIARTGDHLINEAIYYDDPEGNGCECYADRPMESWIWHEDGTCEITTGNPVDLDALAREGKDQPAWRPPSALRIGHINLRVGDTVAAERFWCAAVGLDHTGRRDINFMGTANIITFMSSGRYHHHVAANDFTSRGAGPRERDRAGLSWFAIEVEDVALLDATRARLHAAGIETIERDGGFETRDPWGTRVRFVAA
jgi:catechol 2,3-dioxygenase